jgi:hypothetical protein
VAPKLLVLLDLPDAAGADPLADQLRRLATRPRQGPFLVLDAAQPQRARDELLAAIAAMD